MDYKLLQNYIKETALTFGEIGLQRRELLNTFANYIAQALQKEETVKLVFICTHNSRRSHFGQIWAQMAAHFYKIDKVQTFSGGTEATAFNPNAIEAIEGAGFKIKAEKQGTANPLYLVHYSDGEGPLRCFSKLYNHPENPQDKFMAIMTCTDAEQHCPVVAGAAVRLAIPYEDPKKFDNTPLQQKMYAERCRQIAREMLFVFHAVKH